MQNGDVIRTGCYGTRALEMFKMLKVNLGDHKMFSCAYGDPEYDRRLLAQRCSAACAENGEVCLTFNVGYATYYFNRLTCGAFSANGSVVDARNWFADALDKCLGMAVSRGGGSKIKLRNVTYGPTFDRSEIALVLKLMRGGDPEALAAEYPAIIETYAHSADPIQCELNGEAARCMSEVDEWLRGRNLEIARLGRQWRTAALQEVSKKIYALRLEARREATAKRREIKKSFA